jgi:hypothetical protein
MDIYDILLPPLYLLLILFVAHKYTLKKFRVNPIYRFFIPGLLVKMSGAIALGLVYFFYYTGGDTVNYFNTAKALINTLFENSEDFLYLYFGRPLMGEYYLLRTDSLTSSSEYVSTYWVNDQYAFFVAKCFVPILMLCGNSYLSAALAIATLSYLAVWRLFIIFTGEFKGIDWQFALAILFTPSVVFWGSGIMKDSITFAATCLYVHGFYWFFTKRQFKLRFLLALYIAVYFLISIKPYILFALLPGSLLWFFTQRIDRIRNAFLKFIVTPALIAIGLFVGIFILQKLGDTLAQYSLDRVLQTAAGAQQDLKQAYYGGNTFDIGDYEPTVQGIMSVSHKAIFAALFRPTILDARNIVMFVSALENTFILGFCIYLLLKLKFFRFFGLITLNPLLMFSFVFSIFFAFSVGVSISNFGTLVRLKIPCIPFFLSSMVILNYFLNKIKAQKVRNLTDLVLK